MFLAVNQEMKMNRKTLKWLFTAGFLALVLGACEQQGPMEEAGENIDETVEEAGDKVEESTDRN